MKALGILYLVFLAVQLLRMLIADHRSERAILARQKDFWSFRAKSAAHAATWATVLIISAFCFRALQVQNALGL